MGLKNRFSNLTRDQKIKLLKGIQSGNVKLDQFKKWDLSIYSIEELNRLLSIKRRTENNAGNLSDEEKAFLEQMKMKQKEM